MKQSEQKDYKNVLFLSLLDFRSINEKNIYTDLLREFCRRGNNVFAISPTERKNGEKTHLIEEKHSRILKLKIGNTQKTNIIEKGISTVMIESQYKAAIRNFFSDVNFDLVLYCTPPITFAGVIEYVKKRDNASTYLLLKDIFPQNAVDIGMMSTTGVKGLLYKYFRKYEKRLYRISDRIGCMSQANVDYVIGQNPDVDPNKVEVCPNSIEVIDKRTDEKTRIRIREKYGIPIDKKVFVYGGNLGKPQGIPFLIKCLNRCKDIEDAYFIIVGDGTEYGFLDEFITREKPKNVKVMRRLLKEDYDIMVAGCDVGMIFLDHRFTIPNFPSRLLSYMQARIPVLAATDANTDIGDEIIKGGFGWWCESNDSDAFAKTIEMVLSSDLKELGNNGFEYLKKYYNVEDSAQKIINYFQTV